MDKKKLLKGNEVEALKLEVNKDMNNSFAIIVLDETASAGLRCRRENLERVVSETAQRPSDRRILKVPAE